MDTTSAHRELDYLVRTLSHDMSANFMLLEDSFAQLKASLGACPFERHPIEGPPDQELPGRVAHVEACLCQSRRFLNDLVQLARTGRVEMEPSRVELSAVVDEVLFEQRELLVQRSVHVDVQRPLPVLWCNEGRLKQIVTNLVHNAVHHGCDPSNPRITIAVCAASDAADAADDGEAAFVIHDNGPGIDWRHCGEIFLPGRRMANAGVDGSGMGLAIVKKIADHYGGSVYVDPLVEAGTAFVVCLPQPADPTDGASSADQTPTQRRHWKLQVGGGHKQRHGQLREPLSPPKPLSAGPRRHR